MKRRPNAPYLRLDLGGRLVVNVYRTAATRAKAGNPVAQTLVERGRFDVNRGLLFHVGHVGVVLMAMSDGPDRKAARP